MRSRHPAAFNNDRDIAPPASSAVKLNKVYLTPASTVASISSVSASDKRCSLGGNTASPARSALLKGIGMNLLNNPTFVAYALACVALSCNLMFLWAYSGAARNKAKSTPNSEDTTRFASTLADIDPPEIARVLRAHANAQASIVPFLALGLVYVLAGGQLGAAAVYFTVFTVARWLHSWAYLGARQPLRTIFFVVASLPLLALTVHVVWLLIAAR